MAQKHLGVFLLVLLVVLTSFGVYMNKSNAPLKTYSVTLTTDQWQSRLQTINAAKEIMRKSTLPGNVISQYSDSLDVISRDIQEQVGAQIQREQKADSTNKPKK